MQFETFLPREPNTERHSQCKWTFCPSILDFASIRNVPIQRWLNKQCQLWCKLILYSDISVYSPLYRRCCLPIRCIARLSSYYIVCICLSRQWYLNTCSYRTISRQFLVRHELVRELDGDTDVMQLLFLVNTVIASTQSKI